MINSKELPRSPIPNNTVKKDDLVERVIESIKVLNKKEEEIKQH